MMLRLLSLVLALVFNIAASNDSNCPNRQSIEQSLEKVHIPGAAIVVVNATHTLYEQAFGWQSLSPAQPMDIDKSIFPIASISKTFIAAAVMQLVEEELVDLDTDINQYLSEPHKRIFHPRYPSHSITLRKLLSHSASIAVSPEAQVASYLPGDTAFVESLADMCFKYVNPNTSNWLPKPPGSVAFYSNEGAALAALVVERVAKMPYIQYVKERILKPLGADINKTGVRLADFENTEELVKHYAYAFNTSYLEGWNAAMPQLNITQIPVSASICYSSLISIIFSAGQSSYLVIHFTLRLEWLSFWSPAHVGSYPIHISSNVSQQWIFYSSFSIYCRNANSGRWRSHTELQPRFEQ
jgi:CubicO group peptidase (beta-lactamase class C family)